jgi:hypothetical protein
MDPVTIALLAASAAAGGISGAAKNNTAAGNRVAEIGYQTQNMQQDADAASARNRVLGDYLGRQDQWIAQNQGDLNTGIAKFLPDVQQTQQAGLEAARGDSINGALGASQGTNGVALRTNAPSFVTDAIAKKVAEAHEVARDSGMRLAKMGSYGDSWNQNNRNIVGTAHNIDTTNTIAKGNAALIPQAQGLEEFIARKPIAMPIPARNPWWTTVLDGVAKVGGAAAGASMGAGAGAAAGASSAAQPFISYGVPSTAAVSGGIWPA